MTLAKGGKKNRKEVGGERVVWRVTQKVMKAFSVDDCGRATLSFLAP